MHPLLLNYAPFLILNGSALLFRTHNQDIGYCNLYMIVMAMFYVLIYQLIMCHRYTVALERYYRCKAFTKKSMLGAALESGAGVDNTM